MVSKRLRFEILRRDNFRCVYCGATPDQAELHVDHVVAKSLGGQEQPENLATACSDCNLGKASTSATDQMVADISRAVAIEHAAMKAAAQTARLGVDEFNGYEDNINSIWEHHVPAYKLTSVPRWDLTRISDWHATGVPVTLVEYGLRVALSSDVAWPAIAAYSAAVVRNKMQEARDGANQNHQT